MRPVIHACHGKTGLIGGPAPRRAPSLLIQELFVGEAQSALLVRVHVQQHLRRRGRLQSCQHSESDKQWTLAAGTQDVVDGRHVHMSFK